MGDDELVEQARAGDARAFGQLVERHQRRLGATMTRMTGDPDLALDLTQEAFIRAWDGLGGFEGRAAFSTWLYRIAVRLAYDAMRREGSWESHDLDDSITDSSPGPDAAVEGSARAAELRRRVADLPEMQRAVVTLRTYNELPYKEIAAILETSENSARVSFHHAITRLRAEYLRDGYGMEARHT